MRPDSYNKGATATNGSRAAVATALPGLELLRGVIDSFAAGVVVLDRDLRYLLINERGAALNGLSVADHIGRLAIDVVPDVFPFVEPFYREVFRTAQAVRPAVFQAETPAMPGVARWWDVNYQPLFDAEGAVVAVSATFTDITDKMAAEAKLDAAMQEMRTILDVLPVGLAIAHDAQCSDVELNDTYSRMIQLPPNMTFDEWTRSNRHKLMLNGKEVVRTELPLRKAAASGLATEAARIDVSYEDGGGVNLLVRAAPLLLGGEVRGAVAAP